MLNYWLELWACDVSPNYVKSVHGTDVTQNLNVLYFRCYLFARETKTRV